MADVGLEPRYYPLSPFDFLVALSSPFRLGCCDLLSALSAYGYVIQEIRRDWFRTNGRTEGLVPHNYIRSSGDAADGKTNLPEPFWFP